MNQNNNFYKGGNSGVGYSHPRGYSSDFSDDFGGNEVDPWYSNSPEKPLQGNNNNNNNNNINNSINNNNSNNNMNSYSNYNMNDNNNNNTRYSGRFDLQEDDYENEPPLLEEIGIRFDHIWDKTRAVIMIHQKIDDKILDDADLAGPLVYSLLLGSVMLLSGKVQFGYIYGLSVFGCLTLNAVINLLDLKSEHGIDVWRTSSVLGYSMLPIIGLAVLSIVISLKGFLGTILSLIVIAWSTASATRIFDSRIHLTEQFWLVAYPTMLFYSCFVLMAIF